MLDFIIHLGTCSPKAAPSPLALMSIFSPDSCQLWVPVHERDMLSRIPSFYPLTFKKTAVGFSSAGCSMSSATVKGKAELLCLWRGLPFLMADDFLAIPDFLAYFSASGIQLRKPVGHGGAG